MSEPASAHAGTTAGNAPHVELVATGAATRPLELPPLRWSALSKGECLLLAVALHRLSRANPSIRT